MCNGAILWWNRGDESTTTGTVTDCYPDAVRADCHTRANSHRNSFAHTVSLANGTTCLSHCYRGATDGNALAHHGSIAYAIAGSSYGHPSTADRCPFAYQDGVANENIGASHGYQVAAGEGTVEHDDDDATGNLDCNGYQHRYCYRHDSTYQNAYYYSHGYNVGYECANQDTEPGRDNSNAYSDQNCTSYGRIYIHPNTRAFTRADRDNRANGNLGRRVLFASRAEYRGLADDRSVAFPEIQMIGG